jgi:hypothetical protein
MLQRASNYQCGHGSQCQSPWSGLHTADPWGWPGSLGSSELLSASLGFRPINEEVTTTLSMRQCGSGGCPLLGQVTSHTGPDELAAAIKGADLVLIPAGMWTQKTAAAAEGTQQLIAASRCAAEAWHDS